MTREMSVSEVSPLEPWAQFEAERVYRDLNNFPVTSPQHSAPHAIMGRPQYPEQDVVVAGFAFFYSYPGISLLSVREPRRLDRVYSARGLAHCFQLALGQARLLYGPDVVDLPRPVCVQFVQTEGQHFHFSAFQLNTLRLDDDGGVKNIYWEGEPEDGWTDEWGDAGQRRSRLFEVCDNVMAIPTLEGYNPKVFNRFSAMYAIR